VFLSWIDGPLDGAAMMRPFLCRKRPPLFLDAFAEQSKARQRKTSARVTSGPGFALSPAACGGLRMLDRGDLRQKDFPAIRSR
jgi:hypothetical protein